MKQDDARNSKTADLTVGNMNIGIPSTILYGHIANGPIHGEWIYVMLWCQTPEFQT